jgi:hypothetical protein
MLKIEKFVGEDHERTLKAPDLLVKLANRVLPESAQAELKAQGIDLREIEAAARQGVPFSTTLAVREGGVDKTVVISSD